MRAIFLSSFFRFRRGAKIYPFSPPGEGEGAIYVFSSLENICFFILLSKNSREKIASFLN